MSSKLALNQRYLAHLAKRPLLTKSVTSAVLAVLSELIASIIAKDYKVSTVFNQRIKHPISGKLPLFAFFSATVSAPISHFGLKLINHLVKPPLTLKKRLLQILLTLTTFGPLLNVLFVAFVSVVNLKPQLQSFECDELKRAFANIKYSLRKSLFAVLKSSWVTTPFVLTVCQSYLRPEYWAIFSNLVHFVLGTGQNTLLKIRNRQAYEYQKKRREVEEQVEKELSGDETSAKDISTGENLFDSATEITESLTDKSQ